MIESTKDGYRLRYGELDIPFQIETGARTRLSITVFPESRLRVLAPADVATERVLERVELRAKWIAKQWRFFREAAPPTPPRLYVSGETHWYLGRQYRLKIRESEKGESESVKLAGRFFWIVARDKADAARIQKLLEKWYLTHAEAIFVQRLEKCLSQVRGLDLAAVPKLEIRRMAKRWGSCTREGKILLNLALIQTPPACIDYVLIHELCHLKVPHHSKEFYQLLGRCLPDWEKRKRRLEEFSR